MSDEEKRDKKFWKLFEEWEEDWLEQRQKERLEDAKRLHESEEDYDMTLKALNPLNIPLKRPKEMLGVQSTEPDLNRIPLKDPSDFHLIMPGVIVSLDYPNEYEANVHFQCRDTPWNPDTLESFSFQIKGLIEHILDERLLFFLQPQGDTSFLIKPGWDNSIPPFFEISAPSEGVISIKALGRHIEWEPGYGVACHHLLKKVVKRLQNEIHQP